MELFQCPRNESIKTPATFSPISDHTGFLEHPKVEGKPRLGGIEVRDQVADTTLTMPKRLDDPEPRLVREGVGEGSGALARNRRCGSHAPTLINIS